MTTTTKRCGICGEDCSNRPRTKDAKGRYFCRTCYESALERKRAEQEAAAAESPLSELLQSDDALPSAPATRCPKCNGPVPGGAVLCTACGTNLLTGKKQKVAGATSGGGGSPLGFLYTPLGHLVGVVGIWIAWSGAIFLLEPSTALVAWFLFAVVTGLIFSIWWLVIIGRERGAGGVILSILLPPYGLYAIITSSNRRAQGAYVGYLVGFVLSLVAWGGVFYNFAVEEAERAQEDGMIQSGDIWSEDYDRENVPRYADPDDIPRNDMPGGRGGQRRPGP